MKFIDGWWVGDHPKNKRHPIAWQATDKNVIPNALKYFDGRGMVVQAGARVGLWPKILADSFEVVWSFEPEPTNYQCSIRNVPAENVILWAGALGERSTSKFIEFSSASDGNHQIIESPDDCRGLSSQLCQVWALDDMIRNHGDPHVDAIFLDVEGYELHALQGALETIERCRPALILEENYQGERYGHKQGDVGAWCKAHGFGVAERFGHDTIYTWQK